MVEVSRAPLSLSRSRIWLGLSSSLMHHRSSLTAESFLVGSAMLSFGMGLYTMFVSSGGSKGLNRWPIPRVPTLPPQKVCFHIYPTRN